jgi:hypothetical protein
MSIRVPLPVALLSAALLSVTTARADLVTPDSISPAPTGFVTDQYKPLGLVFAPPSSGIGTVYDGGWASVIPMPGTPTPWLGMPGGDVSVRFVMPGTGAPATTSSVRIRLASSFDAIISLDGYDTTGNPVGSRAVFVKSMSDNWLTLQAPGMHQLDIISNWPPVPGRVDNNSPYFDVEAIGFHPVATLPEPGGLALFGLGALALAARAWTRPSGRGDAEAKATVRRGRSSSGGMSWELQVLAFFRRLISFAFLERMAEVA